jgi:hypothetical protein
MTTAIWIAVALLTPFWWGLGLLVLAWLGDVSPRLRPRVRRLFDSLEHTRAGGREIEGFPARAHWNVLCASAGRPS